MSNTSNEDEDYFVQVSYRRPPPPEAPRFAPTTCAASVESRRDEEVAAELTSQQPGADGSVAPTPDELVPSTPPIPTGKLVPCKGGSMRVLTEEENAREMAEAQKSDNPRVRAMFDMLDGAAAHKPLPDGVQVRQGDLKAPGLVITENPFPAWFGDAMTSKGGFEWDNGCMSYTKLVHGKGAAERWAAWVCEILEEDRKQAITTGRAPILNTTEVLIREDHRALLRDVLS